MRYIREQKDPLTRTPGGYHRADSFIEFRVVSHYRGAGIGNFWEVKGYRPDDAANACLARFDTQEEALEALDDLIECILDPKAEDILCPWPIAYVAEGANLRVSSATEGSHLQTKVA